MKNKKLYELLNRLEDILIDTHNDACSLPGDAPPTTHPPPTTYTPSKSCKIMFRAWDAIKLLREISNIIREVES
ncbi:MAG: hypothetical protein JNJ47_06970 [Alphaproteobacteria bacterium]|nr:hypothetical protein [Alphaproteobacteria bacterium]